MPFQQTVNTQPAPAVAGDFASTNPRSTLLAGPGGVVAGASLFVGRFCWTTPPVDADNAPAVANSLGSGSVAGFLGRRQQGIFTQYLQETTMQLAAGFGVGDIFVEGDFWVVNSGAGQALIGQKAYANFANGLATFAATATPAGGASATSSGITPGTSSFTGAIGGTQGDILTVTGAVTGTIYPGAAISGTGVASGTKVVSQIDGTAGGDGTYYVNIPQQSVAATTISGTYGLLTVGTVVTAGFGVGQVVTGSGGATVTAGTKITALGTGTGGVGTYIVDPTQTSGSGTITVTATNVETKWIAQSSAAPGELVKISSYPQG